MQQDIIGAGLCWAASLYHHHWMEYLLNTCQWVDEALAAIAPAAIEGTAIGVFSGGPVRGVHRGGTRTG